MFLIGSGAYANEPKKVVENDRKYWCDLCYKIASPVLSNMSQGSLRKNMPLVVSPSWPKGRNPEVTYMEAFGRLMAGITPWLELPDEQTTEGKQRKQLREWALASYRNAVDPESPDCLAWKGEPQALVDAAYIATSFIRAPRLWDELDELTKKRYVDAFHQLKSVRPAYNNWLLFRSIIEAFLFSINEEYDAYAIDMSIRKMNEWYLGDGWYGDGPEFGADYYNAYVMHPMLVETIEQLSKKNVYSPMSLDLAVRRMQRYNIIVERMISPEATYPPIGRSITYRMGAFQTLALAAWKFGLPDKLSNGQVRSALTAVMKRMFSMEGIFDKTGFLQLGFAGHQPEIADYYTNNGSLYLTSLVFLPLGLPEDHDFWTSPAEEWTSLKAWGGKSFLKDYHESVKK